MNADDCLWIICNYISVSICIYLRKTSLNVKFEVKTLNIARVRIMAE